MKAHSPETKAEALELLAKYGKAEAAKRTGVPEGTIASWGSRAGVCAPTSTERAELVATMRLAWAERRGRLANDLGEVAEKAVALLLERIEEGKIGNRDLVAAVATLIDRAQLLGGDATQRIELVGQEAETEALAVVEELDERRAA